MLFCGEYQHTIDQKGRIIIPSRFREGLGDKFIITKGLDNCLFAYSQDEWEGILSKLKSIPLTDKEGRAFVRFFVAGAMECEIDKQGRILIPQNLRDYAGLGKDAYILGAINRVEIWDKESWIAHSSDFNDNADKIAEKMSALGI
ncbi:MAG TPA: division/cell wall cluster transcriptional repressor MraZ [Clostridiaceae bacterium]|nr:division/cell wall cluster transcriptional repressor MraZ [Clostridiaceae bacterium]